MLQFRSVVLPKCWTIAVRCRQVRSRHGARCAVRRLNRGRHEQGTRADIHRIPYMSILVARWFATPVDKVSCPHCPPAAYPRLHILAGYFCCLLTHCLPLTPWCHPDVHCYCWQFAVRLMNCNSANEGHRVYTCTPEMSLRECTAGFDGDARTHYLTFANRARATCFQSQQNAIRMRMEATVNEVSARNEESLQAVASIKNGW